MPGNKYIQYNANEVKIHIYDIIKKGKKEAFLGVGIIDDFHWFFEIHCYISFIFYNDIGSEHKCFSTCLEVKFIVNV